LFRQHLQSALYKKKVGDKMEVTYYRGSKEMKATIDLTIGITGRFFLLLIAAIILLC
jgi:hypothetical protein